MEYDFYHDPLTGFRVKISFEQALFAVWLNEEMLNNTLLIERVSKALTVMDNNAEYKITGKVYTLIINHDEIQLSTNQVDDEQVAEQFIDDDLVIDHHATYSGCGYDDFVRLFKDWLSFIGYQHN